MIQEVSVYLKPQFVDGKSEGILNDVREFLHINSIESMKSVKKYRLEGITEEEALSLTKRLFSEDVWQDYKINTVMFDNADTEFEIAYKPGVMNPEVASIMTVAKDLGYTDLKAADSSWHYFFYGSTIQESETDAITSRLLMNKTTEYVVHQPPETLIIEGERLQTVTIPIRESSDDELMDLSKDTLFLNLEEMKVVQNYFKEIDRDPTDCELEMIAQTWSEHHSQHF